MTAQIQLPNTPEMFAKLERRLAEYIHEEAKERERDRENVEQYKREGIKIRPLPDYFYGKLVVELRGIRQALKDGAPVSVDAAFYWSLANEKVNSA